ELPREAQGEWSPPEELQGAIHASVARPRGGGYHVSGVVSADGGTDLHVNPMIHIDRNFSMPLGEGLKIRSPMGGEMTAFDQSRPFDPNLNGPLEQLKAASELKDIAGPHFVPSNPN